MDRGGEKWLPQHLGWSDQGTEPGVRHQADVFRLAEWRRGKYTPSPKVLSQLLYRVLFWALLKAGIQATEAQLDALEELIWKVNVTDGERNIELL
jgi:hypothetical protein